MLIVISLKSYIVVPREYIYCKLENMPTSFFLNEVVA